MYETLFVLGVFFVVVMVLMVILVCLMYKTFARACGFSGAYSDFDGADSDFDGAHYVEIMLVFSLNSVSCMRSS